MAKAQSKTTPEVRELASQRLTSGRNQIPFLAIRKPAKRLVVCDENENHTGLKTFPFFAIIEISVPKLSTLSFDGSLWFRNDTNTTQSCALSRLSILTRHKVEVNKDKCDFSTYLADLFFKKKRIENTRSNGKEQSQQFTEHTRAVLLSKF